MKSITVTKHGHSIADSDTTITGVVRSLQKTLDAGWDTWTVVASDFDAWRREIIDPHSTFNHLRPDYLVYVLSPRILTELPECLRECTRLIADLRGFTGNSQVLCTTVAVDPIHPLPMSETLQLQQTASDINSLLLDFMKEHSWFYLIDQTAILTRHGVTELTDSRFEVLGRMYYSPRGGAVLARSIGRALIALSRPSKKVLVLDLDQSLWRGTLGEDGLSGIRMGDESLS